MVFVVTFISEIRWLMSLCKLYRQRQEKKKDRVLTELPVLTLNLSNLFPFSPLKIDFLNKSISYHFLYLLRLINSI